MAQTQTLIDARVHTLFVGVTQSGKTTLARHHARLLVRAGYDVAVYDPVGTATAGGDWPAEAKIFQDQTAFLEWLLSVKGEPERPWFVFVDESADIFGHGNSDNNWLPRRVRHQNVYLRLISQRPKMLPPNVRTQTAHCYMFRLARDDARMICADFGHGDEIFSTPLDTGDYLLLVSGSSAVESFNCFDQVD
jgi:hypothetical protein